MSMITNENKAEAMFLLAEVWQRNAEKEQRLGNNDRQEQYLVMKDSAMKIAMKASGHGVDWDKSQKLIEELG